MRSLLFGVLIQLVFCMNSLNALHSITLVTIACFIQNKSPVHELDGKQQADTNNLPIRTQEFKRLTRSRSTIFASCLLDGITSTFN